MKKWNDLFNRMQVSYTRVIMARYGSNVNLINKVKCGGNTFATLHEIFLFGTNIHWIVHGFVCSLTVWLYRFGAADTST